MFDTRPKHFISFSASSHWEYQNTYQENYARIVAAVFFLTIVLCLKYIILRKKALSSSRTIDLIARSKTHPFEIDQVRLSSDFLYKYSNAVDILIE